MYDTLDFYGETYEVLDVIVEDDGVVALRPDGEEIFIDAEEIEEQDECFYEKYFN